MMKTWRGWNRYGGREISARVWLAGLTMLLVVASAGCGGGDGTGGGDEGSTSATGSGASPRPTGSAEGVSDGETTENNQADGPKLADEPGAAEGGRVGERGRRPHVRLEG